MEAFKKNAETVCTDKKEPAESADIHQYVLNIMLKEIKWVTECYIIVK